MIDPNDPIWNASTLASFTEAIRPELASDLRFKLVQIHGSPAARAEDIVILERSRSLKGQVIFLLHRPDEILLSPELRQFFEERPESRLIFLGDLIFRDPFWRARRSVSVVIPHPQLDFTKPPSSPPVIVGAFTSWGEMRDPRHYLALVENLRGRGNFDFRIGGTGLNTGLEGVDLPRDVKVVSEVFQPHFNVQLYHLHGRKRYGESSGSLHRGISIPVIFEANGAERIEGLDVVKIGADDDLSRIRFAEAANEIVSRAETSLNASLEKNLLQAKKNTVADFAAAICASVRQCASS